MGMIEDHKDSGLFRFVIGLLAMATAIGGFAALFYVEIPARNENAIMFALGGVFGWASSVIASEYGATTTGRKVAEAAVRQVERQNIASEHAPSGTPDDPVSVDEVGKAK
jgi:predicted RND superfamily exporter protein